MSGAGVGRQSDQFRMHDVGSFLSRSVRAPAEAPRARGCVDTFLGRRCDFTYGVYVMTRLGNVDFLKIHCKNSNCYILSDTAVSVVVDFLIISRK